MTFCGVLSRGWSRWFAGGIGCLVGLACWPAAGQPVGAASSQLLRRSGIPSMSPPEGNVSPPVEHLLGDLGGVRTDLEGRGIYLLLDATTEFAGNVSGDVQRGATFANQVGLEADTDWQRLAGLAGLSTHVIIVNRSGSSDSHLFGDNFLPVQEVYGRMWTVRFGEASGESKPPSSASRPGRCRPTSVIPRHRLAV